MATSLELKRQRDLAIVEQVDSLGDEVRTLALNLAIYLAKAKSETKSEELNRMEPEFIRLVNSTVHVVQEMTMILNAARNMERMIYEVPSGRMETDRLETKLRGLLEQCAGILSSLRHVKGFEAEF